MKIELAHDWLAKQIYEKATDDDKMLVKVSHFIHNRYAYYLENKVFLNKRDLDYINPFLDKIILDSKHLQFIRNSASRATVEQLKWVAGGVLTFIVLFLAAIIFVNRYMGLRTQKDHLQNTIDAVKNYEKQRDQAQTKIKQLLDEPNANFSINIHDTVFLHQLVIDFDSLVQEQEAIKKARDIAQSATLSEIAETELKQTKSDKSLSLQFVEKSLELNPANKQAIKLLADLSKTNREEISKEDIEIIIQSTKKDIPTKGKLEEEDIEVLFSKENNLTKAKKTVIRQIKNRQKPDLKDYKKTTATSPVQRKVPIPERLITQVPALDEFEKLPIRKKISPSQTNGSAAPAAAGVFPRINSEAERYKTLPCSNIKEETSQWTRLAQKDNSLLHFKYVPRKTIALQISKDIIPFIDQEISHVKFIAANQLLLQIKANNSSGNITAQKLVFRLGGFQEKDIEKLTQQRIDIITIVLEDESEHQFLVSNINKYRFIRSNQCFLK